jgi:hypothetical protein
LSFCTGIDGEASRRCAGGGRSALYKLAHAGTAPACHCPHTTTATYTRRASASAMKMPSWLRKTKHDREALSCRGARRSGRTPPRRRWRLTHGHFCASCLRCPGQRITWAEGRPSTRPHRGSAIGATCGSRSARRSKRRTRASTTLMSPSPTAGTSIVPGCRFCQRRRWG